MTNYFPKWIIQGSWTAQKWMRRWQPIGSWLRTIIIRFFLLHFEVMWRCIFPFPFWEHCGGVGMGVNYLFQNTRSFLLFNQISPWLFCTGTQEQGNAVEVAGKTAVSDTARPPPWRIINGRRRLAKSHKTTLPNSTLNTSRPNFYPYWTHQILRCFRALVVPWIRPNIAKDTTDQVSAAFEASNSFYWCPKLAFSTIRVTSVLRSNAEQEKYKTMMWPVSDKNRKSWIHVLILCIIYMFSSCVL